MYPYALFSMHLCLNLSTIKSQKKERKWQKKGSIGLVYTLQLCHSGLSGIVFLMKLLAHADSNSKAKPLLFENWFSVERFNFSFLNEMASKVPKSIFPVVLFKTSFYMYLDAFWGAVCGAETGTLQESGRPGTQEIYLSKSSHGGWLFCPKCFKQRVIAGSSYTQWCSWDLL